MSTLSRIRDLLARGRRAFLAAWQELAGDADALEVDVVLVELTGRQRLCLYLALFVYDRENPPCFPGDVQIRAETKAAIDDGRFGRLVR